jgi:putative spermidine/putrescine transport system ATP-binding protein
MPDKASIKDDSPHQEGLMSGVSMQINEVSKRYGPLTVVDQVSLQIGAGEFVALLGPSGSGKSTLLMSVAGFTTPDSGTIRINGKDVTRVPPRLRNIGMVFQKYALFPHMTVAQNIGFPLVQRGIAAPEIAQRIADAMRLVGLYGLTDRPAPNLSGGQQQRVALARALVFQPPVLLMDEPLGALDKKMREHMQVEIKEIQRATGTTVLFVTHDQTEALSMADRLVVLNHGRVEQVGTPEELYNSPANPFVADFIGEANILFGAIVDGDPQRCRVDLGGGVVVEGSSATGTAFAAGAPVEVILRPTNIHLNSVSADASLVGDVVSSAYFGEFFNVRVAVGKHMLTAKERAHLTRGPGEKVAVSWNSLDAMVFPRRQKIH